MQPMAQIPLEKIKESPTNPRKTFGDMGELTASVKQYGVLQPVLARPKNGHYELVFGHRRYRAAKAAGLEAIPAMVRELTDQEVLEAQVIENVQREDVHPLEEADGYRQLQEKYKKTVDEIAAKVGKSKAYVYARLKLCALAEAPRKLFLEGKMDASVALYVARIPDPKLQAEAAKEVTDGGAYRDAMSAREAQEHIQDRYMLRLDQAPFAVGDAQLVPKAGACSACPKRTGNQKELFPDVKSGDVCTDPTCFKEKREAAWARAKKDSEKEGRVVLEGKAAKEALWGRSSSAYERLDRPNWQDGKSRTWKEILAKAKDVPIVLARDDQGEVVELVRKMDATKALKELGSPLAKKVESEARSDAAHDAAEKRKRDKEKRERDQNRATVVAIVAAAAARPLDDTLADLFFEGCLEASWHDTCAEVAKRRGLGEKGGRGEDVLRKAAKAMTPAERRGLAVELLVTRGLYSGWGGPHKVFAAACQAYRVDPKKVAAQLAADEKKAAAAMPAGAKVLKTIVRGKSKAKGKKS